MISLDDSELAAVMDAAKPLQPHQRGEWPALGNNGQAVDTLSAHANERGSGTKCVWTILPNEPNWKWMRTGLPLQL